MAKIETDHLPITALLGAHTANDNGAEFQIVDITTSPGGSIWIWLDEFDEQGKLRGSSTGVLWNDWIPRFGAALQPRDRTRN